MQYADVIVNITADALDKPFAYIVPDELSGQVVPGARVRVPFGNGGRHVSAFVVALRDTCDYDPSKMKAIEAVLTGEDTADARLIKLAAWMCRTYGGVMAQALKTVLPTKKRVRRKKTEDVREELAALPAPAVLTEGQQGAVDRILSEWERENPRPVLLRGVTGSGKTLIYMELIARVLEEGRDVIVLIPEIALTRQTVMRFVARFGGRVSFLHSRLSDGEKYDQMKAARKGDVRIMVGPRSALFTPFSHLGLIVIDEEHEESYHSELTPRYHARETAIKRAEIEGARVVMGSATPSLTASARAERGEYLGIVLPERYGSAELPETKIVDMTEEMKSGNRSIFSGTLREELTDCLREGGQAMLFLNRRGYAGFVTCRACGYVARCPHCDISLTRHLNRKLVCHYCGYEIPEYETCPACGSPHIGGISVGTEQVEEQLKKEFPGIRTLRMDLDTTRGKEGHGKILKEFGERKADVLIGTQMIVKGHDFPNVTLVGVLLADLSLNAQDYRAAERTFQLITQAAGRAGRGQKPGTAVIQTYKPDHFAILTAAAQNYEAFYKEEMSYRRIMHYPPEGLLLAVLGSGEDPAKLHEAMEYIRRFISRIDPKNAFSAIGPAPQTVGKVRDRYREVIYIRHREREMLVKARSLIERYTEMNSGFADIRVEFNLST